MDKLKKYIYRLILVFGIISVTLIFFLPYFTSDFLDLRQKQENEALQQRILKEEETLKKAQKEALQKTYLMGKFEPATRADFAPVPSTYNIAGYKLYLRKETLNDFIEMATSAKKSDVHLEIVSATRNFDYQKNLWNNKWTSLSKNIPEGLDVFAKILEYSAVPGTSRHHWGTDIDINGVNPTYFDTAEGQIEYNWLVENAPSFGFCQTYTFKNNFRPAGYNEEKWHWSYLPLAKTFTEEYKNLVTDEDIKGFMGDEYVPEFNLIRNYVLSINPECL